MNRFVKITEEICERDEIRENLCDRVDLMYMGNKVDYECCIDEALINCESPIEQLLSLEFVAIGLTQTMYFNPFVDVVAIDKQAEIVCGNNKYRVDFLIPVIYKNKGEKRFIVECDGYEFHQKTKEQVKRDNERTRKLQAAGYEIIRFSGTEIWHKPSQCAREVLNIILSKCEYTKED